MADLDRLDALAEGQAVDSDSSDSSVGGNDVDAVIDEHHALIEFYRRRQGRQLNSLLARYESATGEPCDIIDLHSGTIVVDQGHLRSLTEPEVDQASDSDSEVDDSMVVQDPQDSQAADFPVHLDLYEDICHRPNAVLDKLVAVLN